MLYIIFTKILTKFRKYDDFGWNTLSCCWKTKSESCFSLKFWTNTIFFFQKTTWRDEFQSWKPIMPQKTYVIIDILGLLTEKNEFLPEILQYDDWKVKFLKKSLNNVAGVWNSAQRKLNKFFIVKLTARNFYIFSQNITQY